MADLRVARDHIRIAQRELEQAQRLLGGEIMKKHGGSGQADAEQTQLTELHRKVSAALATLLAGTGMRR